MSWKLWPESPQMVVNYVLTTIGPTNQITSVRTVFCDSSNGQGGWVGVAISFPLSGSFSPQPQSCRRSWVSLLKDTEQVTF